jgi:phosphoglycerate dehydrogenase-like enzyme
MSHEPLVVTFAEPDNMFRLAESAFTGRLTDHSQRILDYFLGARAADGARRLEAASRHDLHPIEVRIREEGQELDALMPGTHVLVTEAERITDRHLGLAQDLELVMKFGSLLDNVDRSGAEARGIRVAAMRRVTTVSCAEHTVMLLLALARRTVVAHRAVVTAQPDVERSMSSTGVTTTRFNWGQVHGIRVLEGATLGLIGFGEIAREVALRATALGMRILFHQRSTLDPRTLDPRLAAARQVGFDELLQAADVVTIHVPGNAGTERLMDADAFARMRPRAHLINMSRGSIVDESALEAALRSGHLAGAGLDVHREEPVPLDCGLLGLETVVWSPHVAGGSADLVLSEVEDLVGAVARELAAAGPRGEVDR